MNIRRMPIHQPHGYIDMDPGVVGYRRASIERPADGMFHGCRIPESARVIYFPDPILASDRNPWPRFRLFRWLPR